uniref:E3 SUMO-protein ligase SIZ1 n=1 Tax=Kalanchoe fedtschenkoi TaxID=63787 RepID=A0A7N0URX0_KALFE
MDLVASCKDKLGYFRVKELKDILTQLGLPKQGKKQDLIDRILDTLSGDRASKAWAKKNTLGKDELIKLLDSTYRKMQASGATDLAFKDHILSENSSLRAKEETDDLHQPESRVRCLCGSSLSTGSMIKCEDPKCNIWQHVGCAIIPDKPTDGDPPFPDHFYCEICRLARADPFLVTVAHQLCPVKLTTSIIPTDGSNPVQSADRTFQLTRADKDLLCKQEYDVQAWCMLLNDKVSFRMQWPQYADLQVNGVPVRAINRPGSQLLGANGRDDGVIITGCTKDGINRISLSGTDSRIFCLGVRIVKRRSLQQILNLIPKEPHGEPFEEALSRVRRCVGGGTSNGNDADSDSDIELVAESIGVSMRCPMSGSRIKIAGRFKPCLHMGCFDLEIFVEMNQRSKKWQCPICLKNYSLENIIIDPYFNRITSKMIYCGEDVTEIEVKPDGSWRVKTNSDIELRDLGDLILWHFPDGSLCPPPEQPKPKMEPLKQVKQEGISEGSTSLKLKKNSNGFWEVRKPDVVNNLSSGYRLAANGEPRGVLMSSSATGSGRDMDDLSVNQDGMGNFDMSANNRVDYDSSLMRVEPGHAAQANADVIVLSDSEDDDSIIPSGPAFRSNLNDASGVNFSGHPTAILDPYPSDTLMGADRSSSLDFFNSNPDEFGMPLGYLPSSDRAIPGFQSFDLDSAPNELLDLQRTSLNHAASMNDYIMNPTTTASATFLLPDSNGVRGPVDDGFNSLLYGGDDPSLQIFLPTRPSGGGGASCSQVTTAGIPLDSRKNFPSSETDYLADNGPLHLSINGGRPDTTNKQGSNSPFSFPRQRRTVRPRLYLSINSDSE